MKGALLRKRRKELNVSQIKLYKMSGVCRYRISMYECNYGDLSREEISKINKALKGVKNENNKCKN